MYAYLYNGHSDELPVWSLNEMNLKFSSVVNYKGESPVRTRGFSLDDRRYKFRRLGSDCDAGPDRGVSVVPLD